MPGVGPAFFQRKAILAYFVCGGGSRQLCLRR